MYQCPQCNGYGGYKDIVCDDGTGPFESCGFCNGTGKCNKHDFYVALSYRGHEGKRRKKNASLRS